MYNDLEDPDKGFTWNYCPNYFFKKSGKVQVKPLLKFIRNDTSKRIWDSIGNDSKPYKQLNDFDNA